MEGVGLPVQVIAVVFAKTAVVVPLSVGENGDGGAIGHIMPAVEDAARHVPGIADAFFGKLHDGLRRDRMGLDDACGLVLDLGEDPRPEKVDLGSGEVLVIARLHLLTGGSGENHSGNSQYEGD